MPFRPSRRGITLKRWRLQNFKSVRDAEVELLPLTVVVGANSAGKSTLLQSIRAASQAIGANGALYPLNGRGVRLGTVVDVKYRGPLSNDEQADIAIQVDEQVPFKDAKAPTEQEKRRRQELQTTIREQLHSERQLVLGADFEFRSPPGLNRPARSDRPRSPILATLAWEVKLGSSTQQQGVARIERLNVDLRPSDEGITRGERVDRAWLLAIADETAEIETSLDEDERATPPHYFTGQFSGRSSVLLDVVDIDVAGGLPLGASVLRPKREVLFEAWTQWAFRRFESSPANRPDSATVQTDPVGAVAELLATIDDAIEVPPLDYARVVRSDFGLMQPGGWQLGLDTVFDEGFKQQVIERLTVLGIDGEVSTPTTLDDLGPASRAASDYLASGIRYLGPLREEPRAAYPDSPEGDDTYVGTKGEFTASVLQRHGRRRVNVPVPKDGGGFDTRLLLLRNAIDRWAKYLDIGDGFSVSDQGRFGIQMQVRQKDVDGDLDLTSVGTGVSQLLPVLVMCLQAPVGSLLLIEQPELHLNPKVQQRLADFLLQIAQSGRHLIVETHSEYLISRLRRHMAEDESDTVAEQVGIYFANRIDGATTYSLVKTNEFGGVDDWPENFFDQATDEEHAILSAAVRKRRNRAAHDG